MVLNLIFCILIISVIVRTVAFGKYCYKENGVAAGISVFFLAACAAATGWLLIFTDKGIG